MKLGPIEQIVIQSTPACNLNCSYCFLSEASRKDTSVLSREQLHELFAKIFSSSYLGGFLDVVWHSGEPLVLKPDYYRGAIESVLRARTEAGRDDCQVSFHFQTNGTLIDTSWCEFFQEFAHCVSVGVSCDGPDRLHNAARKNWGGRGTFSKTLRGMQLLSSHRIPFGLIAVVTPHSLEHADDFYDFFFGWRESISSFHFNLIEGVSGVATGSPYGQTAPIKYYAFVRRLLQRAREVAPESGHLEIQNFNWIYDKLFSSDTVQKTYRPESMSQPFKTLNIDVRGNVSTFYAGLWSDICGDVYKDGKGLSLGNLFDDDLEAIALSAKLQRMADDFATSHNACASSCSYFAVCSGGFNLTKLRHHGTFDATETVDCIVGVQAFTNAVLDDIAAHLDEASPQRKS